MDEWAFLLPGTRAYGVAMIRERDKQLVLKYLCETQRTATLLVQDTALQIRFLSSKQETLTFELLSEPPSFAFEGVSCICLFVIRDRTHAFVVTGNKLALRDDGLPRIEVTVPNRIFMSESRKSFRVTLDTDTLLSFSLEGYGPAKPLNISTGGILAELHHPEVDLSAGAQVTVELSLGSREVVLPARVRRRQGNRIALSFDHQINGEPTPPAVLTEIVDELEEIWMQTRFHSLCL